MSNTPQQKPQSTEKPTGIAFSQRISMWLHTDKEKVSGYLPYVAVCVALVILYIANAHYHIKTLRHIKDTQTDLKEQQAEYVSLKAELAKKTKASEIAKTLNKNGIKELRTPPYIITKED